MRMIFIKICIDLLFLSFVKFLSELFLEIP